MSKDLDLTFLKLKKQLSDYEVNTIRLLTEKFAELNASFLDAKYSEISETDKQKYRTNAKKYIEVLKDVFDPNNSK